MRPSPKGLEDIMLASNTYYASQDIFDGKSQAVRDLYGLLVDELNKLGPVQEIKKAMSISFENRRPFASVLIRNRSLKLVLRTQHRIANQRILCIDRVANKSYDHTVLLDSKNDIDDELMQWLGEAYQSSN
jgi:predicted transport protein